MEGSKSQLSTRNYSEAILKQCISPKVGRGKRGRERNVKIVTACRSKTFCVVFLTWTQARKHCLETRRRSVSSTGRRRSQAQVADSRVRAGKASFPSASAINCTVCIKRNVP